MTTIRSTKRSSKIWPYLVCIFLMGFGAAAQAVEVKNLYSASTIVAEKNNKMLTKGSKQAMAEVIIRVSGDSQALESFDVNQALSNPRRYIEQYSYMRTAVDNPETGLPEPAYELKVSFNARSINQLIRRAGLSIWASNRAEVLVWLVVEGGSGRQLVNADTAPEVVDALRKEANRRGLPIVFPLNDLEDQLAITPADVWGMFMDRVQEASARYGAGAVLVGKVFATGPESKQANWTLLLDQSQQFFEPSGTELAELMAPAVDMAANELASKYAVNLGGGEANFVWLNVQGVQTLDDFAKLTAYLEKLLAIREVSMGQLQEDRTRFRVFLESDLENLKQLLVLDKLLIEIEQLVQAPAVTLAAHGDELVLQGDAVATVEVEEADAPLQAETQISAPVLNYHWHRTYVSREP